MKDISIVVVGTNEREFLEKCLQSINMSKTQYSLETICIDNASRDGTFEMVKTKFPQVTLYRYETLQGYIVSNNFGIQKTSGRYILLLNSDIELKEDTIQKMIDFMDTHPDAAASGCKLLFEDGQLQLTPRRFPTPLTYLARIPHFFRWLKIGKRFAMNKQVRTYLMMDYDHQHIATVDWLVSAFFLIRKAALDDIGLLEERFVQPFYVEDVEWCFRAYLKGWKIYYVPETSAIHYYRRKSVTKLNKLSLVHIANIFIFFGKHGWNMLLRKHRKIFKGQTHRSAPT